MFMILSGAHADRAHEVDHIQRCSFANVLCAIDVPAVQARATPVYVHGRPPHFARQPPATNGSAQNATLAGAIGLCNHRSRKRRSSVAPLCCKAPSRHVGTLTWPIHSHSHTGVNNNNTTVDNLRLNRICDNRHPFAVPNRHKATFSGCWIRPFYEHANRPSSHARTEIHELLCICFRLCV